MVPPKEESVLHCAAIIAARKAAGLERPTQSPDDPWWDTGPHVEQDGRSFYVHAMGCLQEHLGHAMLKHREVVVSSGDRAFEIHGLDGELGTLEDVRLAGDSLEPDEKRLAIELTNEEKRRRWGVSDLDT